MGIKICVYIFMWFVFPKCHVPPLRLHCHFKLVHTYTCTHTIRRYFCVSILQFVRSHFFITYFMAGESLFLNSFQLFMNLGVNVCVCVFFFIFLSPRSFIRSVQKLVISAVRASLLDMVVLSFPFGCQRKYVTENYNMEKADFTW